MKASRIGWTSSPRRGSGSRWIGPPRWPSAGLRSSLVMTAWDEVTLIPMGPW